MRSAQLSQMPPQAPETSPSARRVERVKALMSSGRLVKARRVRLFPFVVRRRDDDYLLIRKDTGSTVSTVEAGARLARMLRGGSSVPRARKRLARRYGCAPGEVDVAPLLESLAAADLIRTVDGHRITERTERWRLMARWTLAAYLWPPLLLAFIRVFPPRMTIRFLRRRVGPIDPTDVGRVSEAVAKSDLTIGAEAVARASLARAKTAHLDRVVLAALMPRKLARWMATSVRVTGLKEIRRLREHGRGMLFCGFHLGSYSLTPFALASRGETLSVLTGPLDASNASIRQRDETLRGTLTGSIEPVSGAMAPRRLLRILRRGGSVLLLCDDPPSSSRNLVDLSFLGLRTRVSRGVGWLAVRSGAHLVPAGLIDEGAGHHLIVGPEVPLQRAGEQVARVDAATRRVRSARGAGPGSPGTVVQMGVPLAEVK